MQRISRLPIVPCVCVCTPNTPNPRKLHPPSPSHPSAKVASERTTRAFLSLSLFPGCSLWFIAVYSWTERRSKGHKELKRRGREQQGVQLQRWAKSSQDTDLLHCQLCKGNLLLLSSALSLLAPGSFCVSSLSLLSLLRYTLVGLNRQNRRQKRPGAKRSHGLLGRAVRESGSSLFVSQDHLFNCICVS